MEVPPDEPRGAPRALVQEADCAAHVVILKVRVPGRTAFVIVAATQKGPGAGLLRQGLRQELWGGRLPAGATRQRFREDALEGASVLGVGAAEAALDQGGEARVLRAHGGRVVVTDGRGSLPDLVAALEDDEARAALEARGEALARSLAEDAIEVRRAEIVKALERARARIERRREAIREDLGKIAQAERIGAQAQWLVAEAARAPRGATKLVVTDWSSGEPVALEVPLDPSKGAREQVEAMFKRAKRLRLGARIAEDRLSQADAQLEAVRQAAEAARAAPSVADIDEAARAAKQRAPRDVTLPQGAAPARAATRAPKGRTPYRTFVARSGRKILVGKGAADNDALTLKVGRPHDLWLHAKDRTGSHVIVPLDKGQTCPGEDLVDAAHLAAHFSEARDETVVDVQHTPRRYLRKPKGSPPGFVIVDREKVLVLRVDAAVLRALLEREETP